MATVLSCSDLSKAFGSDLIFENVSFQLEEHEHLGILGANGVGKSTLLKTIVGQLTPDTGSVTRASGASIGYLAQYQENSVEGTIYEIVLSARNDLLLAEAELRSMEESMERLSGDELTQLIDNYHKKSEAFESKGGLVFRSEAAGVLKGLGFSEEEFEKTFQTLSGGQKTRVNLGRLLVQKPDILILDEPINHLDLSSIEWLEGFLANYSGAVIIVAHDRYFLNRTIDHALDLSRHEAKMYKGNYKAYIEQRDRYLLTREREYEKQQAEIEHQEAVIKKLKQFNREKSIKRAESREKMLAKMERVERPEREQTGMNLVLEPDQRSGNDVLEVKGLSMRFDDDPFLYRNISFLVHRQERVAIIGDNGTGKTTTLKIINGLLKPVEGSVRIGTNVSIGYYDQEQQNLDESNTLFAELQNAYPNLDNTKVRSVLAAFRFTGDDAMKRISELSGGERGRVSLAKLMLSGANVLILDEPTNHLDMDSKEILENALNSFTGTVLYVSHDRYFINQTATRILDLTRAGLVEYLGNYDYYLEKKAQFEEAGLLNSGVNPNSSKDISSNNETVAASDSKSDYRLQKQEKAARRKIELALAKAEECISKLEKEKEEIERQFSDPETAKNSAKLNELSAKLEEINLELTKQYDEWERLSTELED